MHNRPVPGRVYTLREAFALELPDSPHLGFNREGRRHCVQDSHLTEEQTLAALGDTRWRYLRTTYEWIPVFEYADDRPITAFVDIEADRSPSANRGDLWVTPRGFPRDQYVER